MIGLTTPMMRTYMSKNERFSAGLNKIISLAAAEKRTQIGEKAYNYFETRTGKLYLEYLAHKKLLRIYSD
jgi:hypothetical protein